MDGYINFRSFGFTNINCVWTFRSLAYFKLDRVSIADFTSHLGLVYEEIISPFLFDKAEAFCVIKPLYCSCWHCFTLEFHLIILSDLSLNKTLLLYFREGWRLIVTKQISGFSFISVFIALFCISFCPNFSRPWPVG